MHTSKGKCEIKQWKHARELTYKKLYWIKNKAYYSSININAFSHWPRPDHLWVRSIQLCFFDLTHTLSCIFYLQRAVTVCILAQIWTYHVPTDLFQVVRGEHGCTLLVVIIKVTNLLVLTLEWALILPHICKRALLKNTNKRNDSVA